MPSRLKAHAKRPNWTRAKTKKRRKRKPKKKNRRNGGKNMPDPFQLGEALWQGMSRKRQNRLGEAPESPDPLPCGVALQTFSGVPNPIEQDAPASRPACRQQVGFAIPEKPGLGKGDPEPCRSSLKHSRQGFAAGTSFVGTMRAVERSENGPPPPARPLRSGRRGCPRSPPKKSGRGSNPTDY